MSDGYAGENLAFIVGCPRSGTSWLQRLIAAQPSIRTGQESHLFDWYIGPLLERWRQAADAAGHGRGGLGVGCYATHDEFLDIVRAHLNRLLEPMLRGLDCGELFLEKTPGHAFFLREIHRFLPRAHIIHVVRDPRDVVASLLAASRAWGSDWAPATATAAAAMWHRHVRAVRTSAADVPAGLFMELRFEQLHAEPAAALRAVAAFLGRAWDEDGIAAAIAANRADAARTVGGTPIPLGGAFATPAGMVREPDGFVRAGRPGSGQHELSLRQRLVVGLLAGPEMEALGYLLPPGRPLSMARSLLRRGILAAANGGA
jgi:hypothetical protein